MTSSATETDRERVLQLTQNAGFDWVLVDTALPKTERFIVEAAEERQARRERAVALQVAGVPAVVVGRKKVPGSLLPRLTISQLPSAGCVAPMPYSRTVVTPTPAGEKAAFQCRGTPPTPTKAALEPR